MQLKDSQQLEFYENHFHKKGYDTLNCPEYLKKYKKHLNMLSLFSTCHKFFFFFRKITLRRENAKSFTVKN